MPIESARDFTSYLDATTGHGVTGTYFESGKLFDDFPLIDTLGLIDDGSSVLINLIIDQPYIGIEGESISVEGFQPTAILKSTDVTDIKQEDKIVVDAITTNKGNTITPETTFFIKTVEPDNTGFVNVVLEKV
tara:strand:+ start:63 stop:461 length:399 start_codon:yes stop_codon:yes gene_type:complete